MSMIKNLEDLLASGQDSALLRFGLGNAYLAAGQAEAAVTHLRVAVDQDPDYSAAWKQLGKALVALERTDEAECVYRSGMAAAERKGDKQAAKEMRVFLRRLQTQAHPGN
jgi:Tfp pilus assembly protein PilF